MQERQIEDFNKPTQKIIQTLKLHGTQTILGTGADKQIDYYSDIDLQESNVCKAGEDTYPAILKMFQKKYDEVDKIPNAFITDFKCGVQRGGIPVRWNKQSIQAGEQIIDGKLYRFVDCLKQTSIIKMDIIALIDGKFTEFSENYYFTIGNRKTYRPLNAKELGVALLRDFKKYLAMDKPFKALKRLYSQQKLSDSVNKKIVRFLNSKVGRVNKTMGDLEIIGDVMKYDVAEDVIRKNLRLIAEDADKYKQPILEISQLPIDQIKPAIEEIMGQMKKQISKKTKDFIIRSVQM